MSKFYAGIGSRSTPADVLKVMFALAGALSEKGWTLRSGHAAGADQAFEYGSNGKAEIYLPWPTFNDDRVSPPSALVIEHPTSRALELAREYHPAWHKCSSGARQMHARNMHQVMGLNLNNPVKFVLCWTPDGLASGGTGQAIRLAESQGIEVFNLHDQATVNRVSSMLSADRD